MTASVSLRNGKGRMKAVQLGGTELHLKCSGGGQLYPIAQVSISFSSGQR